MSEARGPEPPKAMLPVSARFHSVEEAARYVVKIENVGPERETMFMGDSEAIAYIIEAGRLAGRIDK